MNGSWLPETGTSYYGSANNVFREKQQCLRCRQNRTHSTRDNASPLDAVEYDNTSGLRIKTMARVHVAQMGARLHFTVPLCHQRNGDLAALYTDIFIQPDSVLGRLNSSAAASYLGANVKRMLSRGISGIPKVKVYSFPFFGISAWRRRRQLNHPDDMSLLDNELSATFARMVTSQGQIRPGDMVWSFTDFTHELHEALQQPTTKVMDQCLAARKTYREIMARECADWPEWFVGRHITGQDPLQEKQAREWQSSDHIIAPSDFVRQSLLDNGVPDEKIAIIPYCVDTSDYTPRVRQRNGRLNVLFAGEVGLRKGAHYLMQAAGELDPSQVDIRLIGGVALNEDAMRPYRELTDIRGAVPRLTVPAHYDWADIFVLPSLVEGSAQVVYEALSSGLPVVCTPNAGAPISHDKEGQIIEANSTDSIARAIQRYIDDPDLLEAHSRMAIARRPFLDVTRYQQDLKAFIDRTPA